MKTVLITNIIFLLTLLPGMSMAQFVAISGYINDSNGKALENVSVLESKSGIGTITNKNGFYRLVLRGTRADLKISYDGFKDYSQEFLLSADTTLLVKLEPMIIDQKIQKKESQLQADNSSSKKKDHRPTPDYK